MTGIEVKRGHVDRGYRREVTPNSDRLDCEFEQIFDHA
jgi:hypothetical protein